jgi:hypothetical protein
MNYQDLDQHIPWLVPSENQAEGTRSFPLPLGLARGFIRVWMPGKYWRETREPADHLWRPRKGGDFAIQVADESDGWTRGRFFTHRELFLDVERKARADRESVKTTLIPALVNVVAEGSDPLLESLPRPTVGLHPRALLAASQALSLCERRRFYEHAPLGGRALPARFAVGIAYDLWTAAEASAVEKKGKHGLRELRARSGDEPSFSEVLGHPLVVQECREVRDIA